MKNQLLLLPSPVASSHQEKLIEATELQWMQEGEGRGKGGGCIPINLCKWQTLLQAPAPWLPDCVVVPAVIGSFGGVNDAQKLDFLSVDNMQRHQETSTLEARPGCPQSPPVFYRFLPACSLSLLRLVTCCILKLFPSDRPASGQSVSLAHTRASASDPIGFRCNALMA